MPLLLAELLNFSFFNFKNVKPYTIQKYTKVVATYITHIATHITHADHITTQVQFSFARSWWLVVISDDSQTKGRGFNPLQRWPTFFPSWVKNIDKNYLLSQ